MSVQAAIGMFGYMTDLQTVHEASSITIEVEGAYLMFCDNVCYANTVSH